MQSPAHVLLCRDHSLQSISSQMTPFYNIISTTNNKHYHASKYNSFNYTFKGPNAISLQLQSIQRVSSRHSRSSGYWWSCAVAAWSSWLYTTTSQHFLRAMMCNVSIRLWNYVLLATSAAHLYLVTTSGDLRSGSFSSFISSSDIASNLLQAPPTQLDSAPNPHSVTLRKTIARKPQNCSE